MGGGSEAWVPIPALLRAASSKGSQQSLLTWEHLPEESVGNQPVNCHCQDQMQQKAAARKEGENCYELSLLCNLHFSRILSSIWLGGALRCLPKQPEAGNVNSM